MTLPAPATPSAGTREPVLEIKDLSIAYRTGASDVRAVRGVDLTLHRGEVVGLARARLNSYPDEMAGGVRQRVMIAMALAAGPEVVIMDEPTTALDVVVQRDILAEIFELKSRLGFSVLFITHDLSLLLEI